MAFTGIQIILLILILLLFVRTILRFKDGNIRQGAFLGWTVLWIFGGIAVMYPDSTGRLAEIVGVGRGADVVVYIAVVILFYLLFRLYSRINTIECEITKLVQTLALHEDKEKDESR